MQAYWLRVWRDTKAALGGWPAILSFVVFPILGLLFHYWLDGRGPMSAEAYIWVLYGLAPLGACMVAVVGWNMAAVPYRMQKERAELAEKRIAELEGKTPLPNTVLRSLDATQAENENLKDCLRAVSQIITQYQRLLNASFSHSEFAHPDLRESDIGIIASFVADEATKYLPQLPFGPDEPLIFKTGWNKYKYIFSVPMRVRPKISFPELPKEVHASLGRVSKIDFEVSFWHSESNNTKEIPPQPFLADARFYPE